MYFISSLVFCVLVAVAKCGELDFPPKFKFGAASSAYQVEGAWNTDGKSSNIWDDAIHSNPGFIANDSNADVACDSYHLWRTDVKLAYNLGLHFYRFSIAWSRLLPTGFTNVVNEKAKAYYNNMIDELLRKDIEPVVTLYHWDLPQRLQNMGGWTNPLIVDWFTDYARTAFVLFGDRVKTWITLNEPVVFCDSGYTGFHAPVLNDSDIGMFLCSRHAMLAHAKAWRIYDKEFRFKYHGQVSLSNHLTWYESASSDDEYLTELAREVMVGRYSHPIFSKKGGWPPSLEHVIRGQSKMEGYKHSRLPPFSQEEIEFIRGTFDFYGFNYYTSRMVRKIRADEDPGVRPFPGVPIDAALESDPSWKSTVTWWLKVNPEGIRRQLSWIKKQYGDIKILITENGYPSAGRDLDDQERVQYYRDHLQQVLLAIKEDGVNVIGYTAWCLIDNFEWRDGYSVKFGLYEVDFSSPERTRTPRQSARFYASVISNHSLNIPDNYYELLLT